MPRKSAPPSPWLSLGSSSMWPPFSTSRDGATNYTPMWTKRMSLILPSASILKVSRNTWSHCKEEAAKAEARDSSSWGYLSGMITLKDWNTKIRSMLIHSQLGLQGHKKSRKRIKIGPKIHKFRQRSIWNKNWIWLLGILLRGRPRKLLMPKKS